MRRLVSVFIVICLLTGLGAALAVEPGAACAVIGADLTDEHIKTVYESFGVERGAVTELKVTNAEEREHLDGLLDDDVIGTRSISCIYIETQSGGAGLDVKTSNINWCSDSTYMNALTTAGIYDARVIVTAPFEVSGTAALTGIYKAYEEITGESLDETAKLIGTEELVITSELQNQIAGFDAALIVNDLKLILNETRTMTDAELKTEIFGIAEQYGVSLTDEQAEMLISLCRSIEKLNTDELKSKVESVQNAIKKLAETGEKIEGAKTGIAKFFESLKNFFGSIGQFFSNLFNK